MLKLSAKMDSWDRVVIFSGTKEIGVTYMSVECRIEFINLLNAVTDMLEVCAETSEQQPNASPSCTCLACKARRVVSKAKATT